jgi:hypothetical protein
VRNFRVFRKSKKVKSFICEQEKKKEKNIKRKIFRIASKNRYYIEKGAEKKSFVFGEVRYKERRNDKLNFQFEVPTSTLCGLLSDLIRASLAKKKVILIQFSPQVQTIQLN